LLFLLSEFTQAQVLITLRSIGNHEKLLVAIVLKSSWRNTLICY